MTPVQTRKARRRLRLIHLCPLVFVAACTQPNHLGNPLLLPIGAITTGIENAGYNRQRAQVKAWIAQNEAAMRAEGFNGPVTRSLLASLPAQNRQQTRADLRNAAAHSDFVERATVSVMVHRG